MILILVILLLVLLIPLAAVVLDSPFGRALATRLERSVGPADAASTRRIAQLEAEVDRLSREVSRLDEETGFLHRLLENRTATHGELPPADTRD